MASDKQLNLDEAISAGRLDDFIAQAEADGVAAADAELARPKKKRRRVNPKQFFIVFSPEGEAPPKIMHGTHQGALYAAAAMARYNPEASFFVMGSMSAAVKPREQPAPAEQEAA